MFSLFLLFKLTIRKLKNKIHCFMNNRWLLMIIIRSIIGLLTRFFFSLWSKSRQHILKLFLRKICMPICLGFQSLLGTFILLPISSTHSHIMSILFTNKAKRKTLTLFRQNYYNLSSKTCSFLFKQHKVLKEIQLKDS